MRIQEHSGHWRLREPAPIGPAALAALVEEQDKGTDSRIRTTGPLGDGAAPLGHKRFRRGGFGARLRRLLGPPPSLREWRTANLLRDRGLPVPRPVAWRKGAGPSAEDLYVFEWWADAVDLEHHWLAEPPGSDRRALVRRLGELVKALHASGIAHRDLHAGNLLVRADGSPGLVDFHRARRLGRGPRQRRRDLLDFGRFFHRRATAAEKLRFLRAYGSPFWPARREQRHALLRQLARAAGSSQRRFLRHFEQRCLGGGRAFLRLRLGRFRGVAARDSAELLRGSLGSDPAAATRGVVIHRGRASRVERCELEGLPPLAVKWFEDPGLSGLVKRLLRGSRARRAWRGMFRLHMADIPVPRPLLFAEEAWYRRRRHSFLITRFVSDSRPLSALPAVPISLAGQIARAHDDFLRNRDLKAENLLVEEQTGRVVWLDPDGLRRVDRVDAGGAARDLMRLNASFRDRRRPSLKTRLRFLQHYRRSRRLGRPGLSPLAREICLRTEQKWRKHSPRPR